MGIKENRLRPVEIKQAAKHKNSMFAKYLKQLASTAQRGDAREESFYPALSEMLADVAEATGRKHASVTVLPKPTDAGNPDFRVWNGTDRITGYIEAKTTDRRTP